MAGIGIVFTLACLFYAGSPSDLSWWAGAAVFSIWALAPYAIAIICSSLWTAPASQVLLTIGAGAALLPMPFLAYDVLIAHPSALNGIVFLFVPIYQLAAVISFALAAWWAARSSRS